MASPLCVRNPREKLHLNSAHISSHCERESSLRQGAAENHNHDTEAIMRSGWEQDKKKCHWRQRETEGRAAKQTEHWTNTQRKLLLIICGEHRSFFPQCLNKSQQRWKCQCDNWTSPIPLCRCYLLQSMRKRTCSFLSKTFCIYLFLTHSIYFFPPFFF